MTQIVLVEAESGTEPVLLYDQIKTLNYYYLILSLDEVYLPER